MRTDPEILADAKMLMAQGVTDVDIDEAILTAKDDAERAYWEKVIDKMHQLTVEECSAETPGDN